MKNFLSIKKDELPTFFSLFLIISMIVFNTKVLKILKDTIVVTSPALGAEAIPFLKTWLQIPFSIAIICLLVSMMRRFSLVTVYLVTTAFFLAFYLSYVFLLAPIAPSLVPHALLLRLEALIPHSFSKCLLLVEHWPTSTFYVMCDIWPIIFLSLLFWKYTSEIIDHEQGKRFFPLFSIDIGGMLMAPLMILISKMSEILERESENLWQLQLEVLTIVVTAAGLLQGIIFYKLYRTKGTKEKIEILEEKEELFAAKKFPIRELLEYARSPYFGSLAITVFMFEFSDNLFDILWKDTLGNYYPSPEDFSAYLGMVATFSGILTTIIPFVLSRFLIERLSWVRVAMITPALRITLCTAFFACLFFPEVAKNLGSLFGFTSLGFTVFIGAIQTAVLHMAKCTVFDNTKDLAFMLATKSEQASARAFSDALATKLGKSSSCLAQQGLLMTHATLQAASPVVASLIGVSIPIWFGSLSLSNRYYQERLQGTSSREVLN